MFRCTATGSCICQARGRPSSHLFVHISLLPFPVDTSVGCHTRFVPSARFYLRKYGNSSLSIKLAFHFNYALIKVHYNSTYSYKKTQFFDHSAVFTELMYIQISPIDVGVGTVVVADKSKEQSIVMQSEKITFKSINTC